MPAALSTETNAPMRTKTAAAPYEVGMCVYEKGVLLTKDSGSLHCQRATKKFVILKRTNMHLRLTL